MACSRAAVLRFCAWCVLTCSHFAQADTLTPTLRFKRVANPLGGTINAFAQDEHGFIWIASNEGLVRYDGRRFRTFASGAGATSIVDDTALAVYPDGCGALWVGTTMGLERLDLATLEFEHIGRSDRRSIVFAVLGTKDGLIWTGTDSGLTSYDPRTKAFRDYGMEPTEPKAATSVLSLLEDDAGTLWVGTTHGLAKLDRRTGRLIRGPKDDGFATTALLQDARGRLWAGTADGLYLFYSDMHKVERVWPDSLGIVTTLTRGPKGVVIVGTRENGVFFGDIERQRLVNHAANPNRSDAILGPFVSATYVDRGGVLWVGFNSGGVVTNDLAIEGVSYYATVPGLAFLENSDGTVWIGHEGAGLRLFNPKTGASRLYLENECGKTWITSIVRDTEGWLWLGTTELGVFRFQPATGHVVHFGSNEPETQHLSSDGVLALDFDHKTRTLWIGTIGGGLDVYDLASRSFRRYPSDGTSRGPNSTDVFALHHDQRDPDVMWIGTRSGGLDHMQISSGAFTAFAVGPPTKPGDTTQVSRNSVTSILEADGALWLGTDGGGTVRFDPGTKTSRTYGVAEGLPSKIVYGVMHAQGNELWLATTGGLVQFDPTSGSMSTFTEADGLAQNALAQGAYYSGPSGLLYVGGARGFNIIDPAKLKASRYAGPIQLTGVQIYGQPRPIGTNGLNFSHGDGVITIEFASLSYADPDRIKYRYRLTPLYNDWIEANGASITFVNLPGNKYQLEIEATNHHGIKAKDALVVAFSIETPPWRRWWAYGLYLGLSAVVLAGVFRFQRRRIAALQAYNRLKTVERELELIGALQSGFIPAFNEIRTPRFHVYAYYRPAGASGGDWWWHQQLANGRQVVLVGDATGHGPGAAMLTAAVATAFRVSIDNGLDTVPACLETLNREVLRTGRGKYLMALAAIEIDEATGRWTYYAAGAPPMLSVDQQGKLRIHTLPGPLLGTGDALEFGRLTGEFQPGDRVMLTTDGIPEISLSTGAMLGMHQLGRVYKGTHEQGLDEAAATIARHADKSLGNRPQLDDWTFAIVEWR